MHDEWSLLSIVQRLGVHLSAFDLAEIVTTATLVDLLNDRLPDDQGEGNCRGVEGTIAARLLKADGEIQPNCGSVRRGRCI